MLAACLLALLSACKVGPNYVRPEASLPDKFVNAADARYRAGRADPKFWRALGNETLNGLVERAVQRAYDVRSAIALYDEAVALRREVGLSALPDVALEASRINAKESTNTFFGPAEFARQNTADIGFSFGWELDLWGGARRYREQIAAQSEAAEARVADTQIMIAAEVVRAFAELRSLRIQLMSRDQAIINLRRNLELTQLRLELGRGNGLDVLRARALLHGTEASLPILQDSAEKTLGRLAYLAAMSSYELAAKLELADMGMQAPRVLSMAPPADLLRRRPDVLAAERELAAATARIGVDTALLFPRVRFDAGAGFSAESIADIGSAGTSRRRFGPSLSWGLLEFNETRARIVQAEARSEGALVRYQAIVQRALQEAENSLSGLMRMRRSMEASAQETEAARDAVRLAKLRFDAGASDFLPVLDAERSALDAEQRFANVQAAEITAFAALYKAMGGDFLPQRAASKQ